MSALGATPSTMRPDQSTYTGPVNTVCTVLARLVVPLLDRLAEHSERQGNR